MIFLLSGIKSTKNGISAYKVDWFLVYLMTIVIIINYIASKWKMTVNDEVGETEGSGHGLVKVPTLFLPRVTGKTRKTSHR